MVSISLRQTSSCTDFAPAVPEVQGSTQEVAIAKCKSAAKQVRAARSSPRRIPDPYGSCFQPAARKGLRDGRHRALLRRPRRTPGTVHQGLYDQTRSRRYAPPFLSQTTSLTLSLRPQHPPARIPHHPRARTMHVRLLARANRGEPIARGDSVRGKDGRADRSGARGQGVWLGSGFPA
jgi:hypothetical protein